MQIICIEKIISFMKFNLDFTRLLWHGHYLQLQQVVSGLFFGNFRPQLFLLTFLFQWPKSVFSVMTVEYFVWTLKSPPSNNVFLSSCVT